MLVWSKTQQKVCSVCMLFLHHDMALGVLEACMLCSWAMSHLNSLKPLSKGASQRSVVPVAQGPLHLLPLVCSTGHVLLKGLQSRSQKLVAPLGQHRSHLGLHLLPSVKDAVSIMSVITRDAVRNAGLIVQSGTKKSRGCLMILTHQQAAGV